MSRLSTAWDARAEPRVVNLSVPRRNLVAAVLLAVVAAAPLLVLPGVFFHFDVTPKVLVLLVGTALALTLWRRRPAQRVHGWLAALLGIQAVSLLVSWAVSTDRALSLTGTNWRRFGVVAHLALLLFTYLLASNLGVDGVRRLARVVAVSGSVAAAYGIAQYFGWDPLLPAAAYHVGEGVWSIVRPPGTLGHAGYFAVYLLHVVFAGVALARGERARAWRAAGVAAAALSAIAVVLSGGRGGMLGLVAGAAWLLCRRPRVTLGRAALVAAALAAAAVFYFSPAGLQLRSRTRWFREDPLGGGRLTLWADTLRLPALRWLAGYGPETFASQFPVLQSETLAQWFPERYYESAHNIFVDALAAQGIPGVTVLAMLCWIGLRRRSDPPAEAMAAGLAASLTANQFLVLTIPTALLFYATIAALGGRGSGAGGRGPGRRVIPLAAVAVLLAFAGALAWADYWLARTKRALDAHKVQEAMGHYARVRSLPLPGLDTDLWYSRALVAAASAAWQPAMEAAERATRSAENRANAWYNLAAFCAMQNDFPRTEEALRAAIHWAPRWFKPRWMLAQVLREAGRLDEAETEARRAAELNAGKNPEVARTWQEIQARRQQR